MRLVMIISGGSMIGENLAFGHIALPSRTVGIVRCGVVICGHWKQRALFQDHGQHTCDYISINSLLIFHYVTCKSLWMILNYLLELFSYFPEMKSCIQNNIDYRERGEKGGFSSCSCESPLNIRLKQGSL